VVQLGIAIIPNDEVHNAIRRLQMAVLKACGANPALRQTPHVTLKQPFHAKALEAVEAYFDGLVQAVEPLVIRLHELATFEEDRVIFLGVQNGPQLESLRQTMLHDLGERFRVKPRDIEDERYRFHATIAYNLTEEQFHAAWEVLRDTPVELTFTVDTLGLFYYTGDLWVVYKRARVRLPVAPLRRGKEVST
jgi:2'-5' RNA ligase